MTAGSGGGPDSLLSLVESTLEFDSPVDDEVVVLASVVLVPDVEDDDSSVDAGGVLEQPTSAAKTRRAREGGTAAP